MNNMPTKYKICIVVSTLISVFFFTKWMYKVWPRYEIREAWIENQICFRDRGECGQFWGDDTGTRRKVEFFQCKKKGAGDSWYGECFIKEKIRIN